MEYPHYPYYKKVSRYEERKSRKFKPKMLAYIGTAIAAVMFYFASFPGFSYIALAFLGYGLWHLFSCGCWKAQLRALSGILLVALAFGLAYQSILNVALAVMAFEMFV